MSATDKLSDLKVRRSKPDPDRPYKLFDGGGLFLLVMPNGAKYWRLKYRIDGKEKLAALGVYPDVPLAGSKSNITGEWVSGARDKRDDMRRLLAAGTDPVAAQQEVKQEKRNRVLAEELTVRRLCESWVADSKTHWRTSHLAQVEQSLDDHVYRIIGDRPAHAIRAGDIDKLLTDMLRPDYTVPKKQARRRGMVETTRRIRQRLSAAYSWGMFHHEKVITTNPVASAAPGIKKVLKAARESIAKANFPCVDAEEFPALLRAMRSYRGTVVTRSLLWFVTLTACRTGEARFATWSEIDLEERTWTIPAEKMKRNRRHRVPLSRTAVALLRELKEHTGEGVLLFPHPRKRDKPASENALLYVFAELGYKGRMSGHGLRSMFSMSANKARGREGSKRWDGDLIETALAHAEDDAIRAAYQRHDYLEERRPLMEWWADEIDRLANLGALKVVGRAA